VNPLRRHDGAIHIACVGKCVFGKFFAGTGIYD
jgi:hypothetical protein